MGIHGVDENQFLKLSNQKTLYRLLKESDRVVCF